MTPEAPNLHGLLQSLPDGSVLLLDRALVELWRRLESQRAFEGSFSRPRCEAQAERVFAFLDSGGPLPAAVHPAAALSAVSRFLAEKHESGEEPKVRRCLDPVSGRAFHVLPRRHGRSSRVSRARAGHREYWLRHHQVVPEVHGLGTAGEGLAVEIVRDLKLFERLSVEALPFACGGFEDGARPDWNETSPYRCSGLVDGEARWQSVRDRLEAAIERRARCVVFPELTVDAEVRGRPRPVLYGTVEWLNDLVR